MGDQYSKFSIKLDDLGLTWINKKRDGITKFVLRSSDDLMGIPPKMIERRAEGCYLYSGNIKYTFLRPYLHFVVTVYIPEV
ncbi:unnamed protein product, partial [marine sediment metagenome]